MDNTTKEHIAEFICGDDQDKCPVYRSSTYLTKFFQNNGVNATHDGSTRKWWVLEILNQLNGELLQRIILRLASPREYGGDKEKTRLALKTLNSILEVEGLQIKINGVTPILEKKTPDFNLEEDIEKELKPLPAPKFEELGLEPGIDLILKKRWEEIQKCVDTGAHLAAIILMGSLLEGFILGVMQKNPRIANTASNSPKDSEGKVKHFAEWSLSQMIDTSHTIGWLQLDVKKFSHALRDFRNLIHPYEQLATQANPDEDTVNISWLVVQAACNDMANWIKSKKV
jgi:hypothetical protein